jgi:MATE family multidrug resistance protein
MSRNSAGSLIRRIASLAWPVLVGQWAIMAYGVVDSIMAGHASATDLAALGIGNAIFYSVLVGLIGLVLALNPIISQYFGAGQNEAIGESVVQGIWVALFASACGAALLAFPDVWLAVSHVSDEVHAKVTSFLQAQMFSVPAILMFRVIYALNTSISRPKVVMVINLVGLALKIPLNFAFIYGHWGASAMGATGCGVSTLVVSWITCLLGFWIVRRDSFYRQFSIRIAAPRWAPIREILRIGIPTGLSYIVEITSFTFMALLVARLGTGPTGAHQIAANLVATFYAIPFAFSVATSTLVGQSIGAGQAREARRLTGVGLGLTLAAAACIAAIILGLRAPLVALYTNDAAVTAIAMRLVLIGALNHIADAAQTVPGFVLRAYKHPVAPMLVYCLSLWGIGLGGGFWLAFYGGAGIAPQGAAGLWIAGTASLAIAACALYLYLNRIARLAIVGEDAARALTLAQSELAATG